jgi:hypothetical protein
MPLVTINFSFALNVSVQVTDVLYTQGTTQALSGPQNDQLGTNHPQSDFNSAPTPIGRVHAVDHANQTITINTDSFPAIELSDYNYLFFSKDTRVNTSGIIGYFAETEYRNFTKHQAEIFATAIDFVESSK